VRYPASEWLLPLSLVAALGVALASFPRLSAPERRRFIRPFGPFGALFAIAATRWQSESGTRRRLSNPGPSVPSATVATRSSRALWEGSAPVQRIVTRLRSSLYPATVTGTHPRSTCTASTRSPPWAGRFVTGSACADRRRRRAHRAARSVPVDASSGLLPNVRCTYQSGRHQVVRPSAVYEIPVSDARSLGALQVNSRREMATGIMRTQRSAIGWSARSFSTAKGVIPSPLDQAAGVRDPAERSNNTSPPTTKRRAGDGPP